MADGGSLAFEKQLEDIVPQCVYDMRQTIKAFLNVFK